MAKHWCELMQSVDKAMASYYNTVPAIGLWRVSIMCWWINRRQDNK